MTRRLRGERGSVSLLVVIMVPALLMAAGLVLDVHASLHPIGLSPAQVCIFVRRRPRLGSVVVRPYSSVGRASPW